MLIISTASLPSLAEKTSIPTSSRIAVAISRLSSLSSTIRIFFPFKKSSPFSLSSTASRVAQSAFTISERNNGFEHIAVMPAPFASASISAQSQSDMITTGLPCVYGRILFAVSMPFASHKSQSMTKPLNSFPLALAESVLAISSLSDCVHSALAPIMQSVSLRLSQAERLSLAIITGISLSF